VGTVVRWVVHDRCYFLLHNVIVTVALLTDSLVKDQSGRAVYHAAIFTRRSVTYFPFLTIIIFIIPTTSSIVSDYLAEQQQPQIKAKLHTVETVKTGCRFTVAVTGSC